jgi:hypothetical protein
LRRVERPSPFRIVFSAVAMVEMLSSGLVDYAASRPPPYRAWDT